MAYATEDIAIQIPASWKAFDGLDLPAWMGEDQGNLVCSFLNHYIPGDYSRRGTRYHLLNRFPGGRLYFHLLNRP